MVDNKNYELKTRNGHNLYDMASMMQKAIRRCDINRAGYAAYELYGKFQKYMWRRLLVISAEDCYGIITREIVALQQADEYVNAGRKGYDKDAIFVGKAVYLLCIARKSRDACYLACNFMIPDRILEPDEIPDVDISKQELYGEIPDWVFDCHTLKGKSMGRTDVEMTINEQEALTPHQIGLFDDCSWQMSFEDDRNAGRLSDKEWNQYLDKLADKISDPTPGYIMDDRDVSVIKLEKIKKLFKKGKPSTEDIKKILDEDIK